MIRAYLELVARRLLDELPSNVLDAGLVLLRYLGVALPVAVGRVRVQSAGRRVRHPRRRHESCDFAKTRKECLILSGGVEKTLVLMEYYFFFKARFRKFVSVKLWPGYTVMGANFVSLVYRLE